MSGVPFTGIHQSKCDSDATEDKVFESGLRGKHRGIIYPYEAIHHHAPLTPRSKPSTGLFKRASECTGIFSRKTEIQKAKPFAITGGFEGEAASLQPKFGHFHYEYTGIRSLISLRHKGQFRNSSLPEQTEQRQR